MSSQWRGLSKCAGLPIDLFFPPRDGSYRGIAAQAKAACRGLDGKPACEVRGECLWDAVCRKEPHGIWGGMSGRERNAAVRRWRRLYQEAGSLEEYMREGAPRAWT
jgi:hypothetical protein